MTSLLERQLARIEGLMSSGTCQTCFGWPSRLVCIDAETGEEIESDMPAEGCQACGRPIVNTYEIVGMTLDELP